MSLALLRSTLGTTLHEVAPEGTPQRARALALGQAMTSRAGRVVEGQGAVLQGGEGAFVDSVLPDGGLPRGAVTEIAGPRGLGRATSLALAACAAAQAEARGRAGDPRTVGAWCALLDPWGTLHAPGLVARGVDPTRLCVVRPPVDVLARVAVRVVESRAFSVVVIDAAGLPGTAPHERVRLDRWGTVVRRLALAVERTDTAVVLLTDAGASRAMPLPVALRLELSCVAGAARPGVIHTLAGGAAGPSIAAARPRDRWLVRVAKERHGRVGGPLAIAG